MATDSKLATAARDAGDAFLATVVFVGVVAAIVFVALTLKIEEYPAAGIAAVAAALSVVAVVRVRRESYLAALVVAVLAQVLAAVLAFYWFMDDVAAEDDNCVAPGCTSFLD